MLLSFPRLSEAPQDQGLFRTRNLNDEEIAAQIQIEQVRAVWTSRLLLGVTIVVVEAERGAVYCALATDCARLLPTWRRRLSCSTLRPAIVCGRP